MKYNPQHHKRRSSRLPEYDYSNSGIYFVTICTHQKLPWFGEIRDNKVHLNQIGKIVEREWLKSSEIRQEIKLDEWVIMPNHLHGLVVINQNEKLEAMRSFPKNYDEKGASLDKDKEGASLDKDKEGASLAPLRRRKPRSLSSFVAGFKSSVTKQVRQICQDSDLHLWQRNFYESIIRDQTQLNNIRQYIINNPLRWNEDPENQNHQSFDFPF